MTITAAFFFLNWLMLLSMLGFVSNSSCTLTTFMYNVFVSGSISALSCCCLGAAHWLIAIN